MLAGASAFVPPIVHSPVWGLDEDDDRDVLLLPRLLQCLAILHLAMTTRITKLPKMDLRVARLCMRSTRLRHRMIWIGKAVSFFSDLQCCMMFADCDLCRAGRRVHNKGAACSIGSTIAWPSASCPRWWWRGRRGYRGDDYVQQRRRLQCPVRVSNGCIGMTRDVWGLAQKVEPKAKAPGLRRRGAVFQGTLAILLCSSERYRYSECG
jgi:hypothetical protein